MNTATLRARVRRSVMAVIAAVAAEEGVTVDAILNEGRAHRLTLIRQRAMWRAKVETGRSDTDIARVFRRDRSTVKFGISQHEKRLTQDGCKILAAGE